MSDRYFLPIINGVAQSAQLSFGAAVALLWGRGYSTMPLENGRITLFRGADVRVVYTDIH